MTISNNQLATWSHQGAVATARATHERIRAVIEAGSYLVGTHFDTFLQGSYRNDTNIRGDSDVDIVVELDSVFVPDTSDLPGYQKIGFNSAYPDAAYGLIEFHKQVAAVLASGFGQANVTVDNKCIRVRPPHLLHADVVIAEQYRRYAYFYDTSTQKYFEGIRFLALRDQRWVVNHPKLHYQNGVAKNSERRTGGRYKPTIRAFKNARRRLVEKNLLERGTAPSYFVECLLYNVPDEAFVESRQVTYLNVLGFLTDAAVNGSLEAFRCQSEQLALFGTTPEQWSLTSAHKLIQAWFQLWEEGP